MDTKACIYERFTGNPTLRVYFDPHILPNSKKFCMSKFFI